MFLDKINLLKIKWEERIRIYRDSPNAVINYVDIAQVLEDLIELLSLVAGKNIGFRGDEDGGKD